MNVRNDHSFIDCLAHVIDCKKCDGYAGQRFHLDAGLAIDLDAAICFDGHGVTRCSVSLINVMFLRQLPCSRRVCFIRRLFCLIEIIQFKGYFGICQIQYMAHRDKLGCFLCTHDTGHLRNSQDISLLDLVPDDCLVDLAAYENAAASDSFAVGRCFLGDVDHKSVAIVIEVCEFHMCSMPFFFL